MSPINHDHSNDLYVALVNLAVVAMIAAVSIAGLLRLVDQLRPGIGDIISFDPAKHVSLDSAARIAAVPSGSLSAPGCVLDLRALRQSGGSLVIDAVHYDPEIIYMVHWAGGQTSDGRTNCGASAELWINQTDIVTLKLAADG